MTLSLKGIIVVAISVDIIGIQLFSSFVVLDLEEPAASGVRVGEAGGLVDGHNFRVDELSIDHILESASLEGIEGHDSVSDDDAEQVDRSPFSSEIMEVDLNSKVGNVLSRIRFSSDEHPSSSVLWELDEEVNNSVIGIVGSIVVIILVLLIQIIGKSNSGW